MKKFILYSILILSSLIFFSSCEKEDDDFLSTIIENYSWAFSSKLADKDTTAYGNINLLLIATFENDSLSLAIDINGKYDYYYVLEGIPYIIDNEHNTIMIRELLCEENYEIYGDYPFYDILKGTRDIIYDIRLDESKMLWTTRSNTFFKEFEWRQMGID